jgi:23S rRNA (uracil1939-C5)-methyltransferase
MAELTARCRHFAEGCGGCTTQDLAPEAQLRAKEKTVRDVLARGALKRLEIRPIIAAPEPWLYRNRMEFSFHASGTLGMHVRGAWNKVFSLEECFLQSELSTRIVRATRDFVRARGTSLDDPEAHAGLLRLLVVRQGEDGATMVAAITRSGAWPEAEEWASVIAGLDPRVKSVLRGVNDAIPDRAPLSDVQVLRGEPFITDRLAGLRFKVGLETFFQTNTRGAERLVSVVREMAEPARGQLLVDLFCGVGTFTLALARDLAARVVGIELVPASIEAARENAALNGIANVEFHAGDVKPLLPDVLEGEQPDVVVLDPPRNGAGGKVMRRIARLGAGRVVYVSCGPKSLARDLQELIPFGYRIAAVQPLDLFPQTHHVETVVALDLDKRRSSLWATGAIE